MQKNDPATISEFYKTTKKLTDNILNIEALDKLYKDFEIKNSHLLRKRDRTYIEVGSVSEEEEEALPASKERRTEAQILVSSWNDLRNLPWMKLFPTTGKAF